ncbi:hypothetical protein MJT46_013711 [Ovis ammon polii x Ovis aries]|nr:hypothetical protein MJT46_013711 [Ovis ammon polii x Ovis aries]
MGSGDLRGAEVSPEGHLGDTLGGWDVVQQCERTLARSHPHCDKQLSPGVQPRLPPAQIAGTLGEPLGASFMREKELVELERGRKYRGPITGCGLLLHCVNKVGVYRTAASPFAANPHSARADIDVAISGGASMGSVQSSLHSEGIGHPQEGWLELCDVSTGQWGVNGNGMCCSWAVKPLSSPLLLLQKQAVERYHGSRNLRITQVQIFILRPTSWIHFPAY